MNYISMDRYNEMEQRAKRAEAERDELQRLLGQATSERDALKADAERLRNEFRRECDDADKICRKLNLPGSWRTDGGSLHLPRIFAAVDKVRRGGAE